MFKFFMCYIFCPFYILCAGFCCSEPPEPDHKDYNAMYLNSISIANNQKLFTVGDTLWLNVAIPNRIEASTGVMLNINELTGATTAEINLVLLFQTQYNNLAKLTLSENEIINDVGTLIPESYESLLRSQAVLENDVFRARHGILLLESGIFSLEYPFSTAPIYNFYSEYNETLINAIHVETSFNATEQPNKLRFEVTN